VIDPTHTSKLSVAPKTGTPLPIATHLSYRVHDGWLELFGIWSDGTAVKIGHFASTRECLDHCRELGFTVSHRRRGYVDMARPGDPAPPAEGAEGWQIAMRQMTSPSGRKGPDRFTRLDTEDYGGVLGADGQVYSDADPGL
jgi:hypothetical protein